jgi:hypothetical protein
MLLRHKKTTPAGLALFREFNFERRGLLFYFVSFYHNIITGFPTKEGNAAISWGNQDFLTS